MRDRPDAADPAFVEAGALRAWAKLSPFGISSIRHDVAYESTTIFDDFPARRPRYPIESDVYQEIIPSIGDAYPYPINALFLYMGSPVYSLPAGHTNIEVLSDPKKLPLFVTSDIVVGETSMYSDYIFPDLERSEFAGSHPASSRRCSRSDSRRSLLSRRP